jgi:uncharacterized membrane protein YphA (DoxX/SURF4 family)
MIESSRAATIVSWTARLVAAGILLQTLWFKFTGAPESVYIFDTLGVEPWGRLATGVLELVAAALLLWPRTAAWGALLAAGIVAGAILSHLTFLGIEVQGDGGLLFGLALTVLAASLLVLWLHRGQLPVIGRGR